MFVLVCNTADASPAAFSTCAGPTSRFVGEPFTVLAARDNAGTECTVHVGVVGEAGTYVTTTLPPQAPNATIAVPAVAKDFGRFNISCQLTCLDGQSAEHLLPLFVAPVPNPLPDGVAPLYSVTAALVYQDPATGADFLPTPTNVTAALSIFFPRPGLFPVPNETMWAVDRVAAYHWRWTQHGTIAANSMTNIAGGTSTAPAPLQFGALPAGMTRFASFAVYVADWDVPVGFVPVCGTSGAGRCPSVFQVSPPSLDHGWNQVTFTFSAEAAADPLTLRLTTQSAQLALLQSVVLPPTPPSSPTFASCKGPSSTVVGASIPVLAQRQNVNTACTVSVGLNGNTTTQKLAVRASEAVVTISPVADSGLFVISCEFSCEDGAFEEILSELYAAPPSNTSTTQLPSTTLSPPPAPTVPAFATCVGPSSVFVGEAFTVLAARDNVGTECTVHVGVVGEAGTFVTLTLPPQAPNATIAVPAVAKDFGRLNISFRVGCRDGRGAEDLLPLFVAPVPKALPDGVAPLSTVSTALVYQDPATGADFLPTPTNVTEALSIFFPRPGLFPVPNETMRVVDRGVAYDWRWTQHGTIAANSMTNIAGGIGYAPAPLQFGALPAGMTRFASFAVYVADWDVPVGFVPVCGASGGGRCPSVFQVSPPSLDHGWNQVTFTFSTKAAADPLTLRVTKQSAGSALLQSVALPPAAAPTTAAPTQPPSDDHSYGRYIGIGVGAAVGVALAIAVVAVVVVRRQRRVTTAEKAILYSTQEA